MKALVAALNRIATALEQLVPALTQATREAHGYDYAYKVGTTTEVLDPPPPDPRYPEDGNG